MKIKFSLKTTLYSMITIFVLLLIFFIVPFSDPIRRALFPVAGIVGLAFLVLGIILTCQARKQVGKLKIFLLLTGISAMAPLVGTILHNAFYALGIIFEKLSWLFEFLHASFFIISLLVAPIVFLVGIVGSIILFKHKK